MYTYLHTYNMIDQPPNNQGGFLWGLCSYGKGVVRVSIQHTLDTCPIPIFNDEEMDCLYQCSFVKPSLQDMKKSFPEGSMITWQACAWIPGHMVVSWNRGTPKTSILMGFSLINHPFGGTSIYGNPHIGSISFLGSRSPSSTPAHLRVSFPLKASAPATAVHE